jgi:PBP1b-binding outer membrane lipoprotein LpoB
MEVVKEYHKDVIGVVLLLILTAALLNGCSMSQEEFVAALDAGVSEVEVDELRPTATVNAIPQEVIESTNEIIVPVFDEQDNIIGTEVLSE